MRDNTNFFERIFEILEYFCFLKILYIIIILLYWVAPGSANWAGPSRVGLTSGLIGFSMLFLGLGLAETGSTQFASASRSQQLQDVNSCMQRRSRKEKKELTWLRGRACRH